MFRRILVANRGEVAARVMRTCRRLGVEVVAVASQADLALGWLKEVDEVVCLGPGPAAQSYLNADAILEAAVRTGATAIHPGWGFLAENATFASRCEAIGLTFIGPPASVMRRMGDKIAARSRASSLGLPVIPGSPGALASVDEARVVAQDIGYPVLLKAASGGGGRGMRRVYAADQLASAWQACVAEAQGAFGDATLYMEKLIEGGRHIEFQVVADRFGNAVTLGERECSIQRRHQKLLEESPSPVMTPALRADLGSRVASAASGMGYRGAGTIEMLRDANGALYFMEMNTRLQVEHPVTEAVFGVDLVEWQLRVAANQRLPLAPDGPVGHAIEARINAEDPSRDFAPCPGRVTKLVLPEGEGIRVDTHLRSGDAIPPFYDSMICKVIAHGATRAQAITRLQDALAATCIEGVPTTIPLHQRILRLPSFVRGDYDTSTLETLLKGDN
jgi:acetyl-CoA carboxylase biotin carboxylase subunit